MYTHTNWDYCLVKDDDGHWFLIPSIRYDEWQNWIDQNLKDGYEADWMLPHWAQPIDGPHTLIFSNPRTRS